MLWGFPICWDFDNQELALSKMSGLVRYAMGRDWTNGIDHCAPPCVFTRFYGRERASLTHSRSPRPCRLRHCVLTWTRARDPKGTCRASSLKHQSEVLRQTHDSRNENPIIARWSADPRGVPAQEWEDPGTDEHSQGCFLARVLTERKCGGCYPAVTD